jgi:uncharacterized coiled-coil protein SlyX
MTHRWAALGLVAVLVGFAYAPALVRGQGTSSSQHDQHHTGAAESAESATVESRADMKALMMGRMKANGARLDALVEKMREARGAARIDAMEELLTALVEERRDCERMMADMPSMMNMMDGHESHGTAPTAPKD